MAGSPAPLFLCSYPLFSSVPCPVGSCFPSYLFCSSSPLLRCLFILLHAGVHPNPGPLIFPYGCCVRNVTYRGFSICCSHCSSGFTRSALFFSSLTSSGPLLVLCLLPFSKASAFFSSRPPPSSPSSPGPSSPSLSHSPRPLRILIKMLHIPVLPPALHH